MRRKVKIAITTCAVLCTTIGFNSFGKEEVIRIGYNEELSYIKQSLYGDEEGIWVNYFQHLSNISDLKFEFVPCKEYELDDKFESGEIDMYGPVEKYESYEEKYTYSSKQYGMDKVVITAPSFNGINYGDTDTIEKSRLLIRNPDLVADELREYFEYNEITPDTYDMGTDGAKSQDFQYQAKDLFVTTALQMDKNNKIVAEIGTSELYFIASKNKDEKLNSVTQEMTHQKNLGVLSFESMYYDAKQNLAYAKQVLTEADMQLLNKKDTYVVGYLQNNDPVSYLNEQGELCGLGIDVMNKLAYDGRFNVKYIDITSDPYRKVDFYLGVPEQLGEKYEGKKTISYQTSPYMIVGRDRQYNSSLRIGYLGYEGLTEDYLTQCFANVTLVKCSNIDQLCSRMKENKVDYAVVSSLLTKKITDSIPYDCTTSEAIGSNRSIEFAVSDQLSSDYILVLNKLILRMGKEAEITTLINSQLQYNGWTLIRGFLKENLMAIRIATIIGIGILIFYMFGRDRIRKMHFIKTINYDSVTGYLTEKHFVEMCERRLRKAKGDYEIISIDIDNFKHVNDMISYDRGTELLMEFGEILREKFVNNELITRVFADKFLILVNRDHYAKQWDRFNVKDLPEDRMLTLNRKYNMCLYVSIGVYKVPTNSQNIRIRSMINAANAARAAGKNIYGNTLIFYNEFMEEKIVSTNNVIKHMENAITEKEFKAFYQPKVNLQTGEIAGAEALVRWIRKDGTMVFPDQFIPVFEKNSFIITLDCYMFETVCDFLRRNQDKQLPVISVNLSSVTLLEESVVQRLLTITQVYEIPTDRIELEVTESAFIEFEQIKDVIDEFKEHGFIISMDDFGTGVSSLGRLKELPVDVLKIDKQFLNNITQNTKGYLIMKHIIEMAQELESETISEGVETIEEARLLKRLGCDLVQGYFFSRPISEEKFLQFIENYQPVVL